MRVFITGTAGFIGFHLARRLLDKGFSVFGYDGFTDYYDSALKRDRHNNLSDYKAFSAKEAMLEDNSTLNDCIKRWEPEVIIHLAAQAGVRYSLDNPRAYIDSNLVGSFNLMEAARIVQPRHLLMASTSSVYGANVQMPFCEADKTDQPLTIYAASKKANEVMAHSYAHLWGIPTTMFRFFTVYGPWGRPDLALFKFVDKILADKPIDIYNHGEMYRDFTYIDDLVEAICLLMDRPPEHSVGSETIRHEDNLSAIAPYRIVNIGNSTRVKLLDFVDAIEECLGKKAIRNYMDMQKGDVPSTWADATLLHELTGYKPQTDIKDGIARFVEWFRAYYKT